MFPPDSPSCQTSRARQKPRRPLGPRQRGWVESSFESPSLDAARPRSGKIPSHSKGCTGSASPLQRQNYGSTASSETHLASSWGQPPNPPLPRGRAPAHLPGTKLAAVLSRCSLDTALSRSQSASPRGGGAAYPEAALPLPAPTGTQPTLRGRGRGPGTVPRPHQVPPTLGGLESWPIWSFLGARAPARNPHPAPASLEVGRPEGVHVGNPEPVGGALPCNPELIPEFT